MCSCSVRYVVRFVRGGKNEMVIPAVGVRKGKKKEDRFDRRYDGRMKKKFEKF